MNILVTLFFVGLPLPRRFNIIISDDYEFKTDNIKMDDCDIKVVHSIEHALDTAEYYNDNDLEVFIIGGGWKYL
jgi:dihydrofolate reductase